MLRTVNERLLSRTVNHAVGVQRLAAGAAQQIIDILDDSDEAIFAVIRSRALGNTNTALRTIHRINERTFREIGPLLAQQLHDLVRYEIDHNQDVFDTVLPFNWELSRPKAKFLRAIVNEEAMHGGLLDEWIEGMATGRYTRIRQAIRIGVTAGETPDEIIRRIRGQRALQYRNGVAEINRRSARAVVSTLHNHVANKARATLYGENADLIYGGIWTAVLDDVTCDECAGMEDTIIDFNEVTELPPLHLNCRCAVVPLVASADDLDLDDPSLYAMVDGRNPGKLRYSQWLMNQSRDTQDDILGKDRATLFRRGMPIKKFRDHTGRRYSLPELKRIEGGALKAKRKIPLLTSSTSVRRTYGWKPDLPDQRDFLFATEEEKDLAVPVRVSLREKMPPVFDQGDLGSCFVGETRIPLLNGHVRTIKELAEGAEGKVFWVYALNDQHRMVPAKATASKTGIDRELVRVVLSNGEEIICTPDHKFMLRNGRYCEASGLKPGRSLMSLRRKANKRGYELVWSNEKGGWNYTHWLAKSHFEKRPDHAVIHHVDFDKHNNAPDNLQYMGWTEHTKLHAKLGVENLKKYHGTEKQREDSRRTALKMHRDNPGWNLEAASNGGKAAAKSFRDDPIKRENMLRGLAAGRGIEARSKANISIQVTMATPSYKKKHKKIMHLVYLRLKKTNAPGYQNMQAIGRAIGGKRSSQLQAAKFGRLILDRGLEINLSSWNLLRKERQHAIVLTGSYKGNRNGTLPLHYETALKAFDGSEQALSEASHNYNCKVVSVQKIKQRADVYCLAVPKYHNFALEAGVYVHNCVSQALVAAVMFAFGPETPMLSRLDLYYKARLLEDSVESDDGCEIRDGIKALAKWGVATEATWPYKVRSFRQQPSAAAAAEDDQYRIKKYMRLKGHGDFMRCLAQGYPFVGGYSVYDSFDLPIVSDKGVWATPHVTEKLVGGHAVLIVGVDLDFHTNPVFKASGLNPAQVPELAVAYEVRNSFGTEWGEDGYFWMPAEVLENRDLSDDFWTIRK